MNKVILVGRLTRDPEMKTTAGGRSVTTFTLAIDRRFKNKDGQKEADFIPVVVWGKPAELAAQYLSKGRMAGVCGRMQVRSYDGNDGQKRYVTEVVADELNFLPSGERSGQSAGYQQAPAAQPVNSDNMSAMGLDEDFHLLADDDDVPF